MDLYLVMMAGICLIYYVVLAVYNGLSGLFQLIWIPIGLAFYALRTFGSQMPAALYMVLCLGMIALTVLCLLASLRIRSLGRRQADAGADYMIVLGCGLNKDKIPASLERRLDTAMDYLDRNPETVCIVSGGMGINETVTEASAMRKYLNAHGIAGDRILMEERSVNTDENIRFSREMMSSEEAYVVVVTNTFHLFRALKIAGKQGLKNVQGIGAPDNRIMAANYYLREILAICQYKLQGRI